MPSSLSVIPMFLAEGEDLTKGVDCSGFTMLVLRHFGINVAHYTGWQYEGLAGYAKPVKIAVEDLKPGDLIFYYANNSHVGIYIGDGKIVHASNSAPYPQGGIKISNYDRPIFTVVSATGIQKPEKNNQRLIEIPFLFCLNRNNRKEGGFFLKKRMFIPFPGAFIGSQPTIPAQAESMEEVTEEASQETERELTEEEQIIEKLYDGDILETAFIGKVSGMTRKILRGCGKTCPRFWLIIIRKMNWMQKL